MNKNTLSTQFATRKLLVKGTHITSRSRRQLGGWLRCLPRCDRLHY